MKPLRPSLREKKRYLLVKGNPENIEKSILDFVGILGMSKTGINWIKRGRDYAIISINRKSLDVVRASLCVWPEKMVVEKVSGTLKKLREKI